MSLWMGVIATRQAGNDHTPQHVVVAMCTRLRHVRRVLWSGAHLRAG